MHDTVTPLHTLDQATSLDKVDSSKIEFCYNPLAEFDLGIAILIGQKMQRFG